MTTKRKKLQYLNKANRFIFSHPKFYLTLSGINTSAISHNIHKELSMYNDSLNDQSNDYHELSQSTDIFLQSYHQIQKTKEKEKERIKDKKLKSPFLDLINQYITKGYKIPDLSYNKNLFNPSILLSEPSKVLKIPSSKPKTDLKQIKDVKYLRKLNKTVIKTSNSFKKAALNGSPLNKSRMLNPNKTNPNFFRLNDKMSKKILLSPQEIKKENKAIKQYNKEIKKCIEEETNEPKSPIKSRNNKYIGFLADTESTINKKFTKHFDLFTSDSNQSFFSKKLSIMHKGNSNANITKKLNLFKMQKSNPKMIKAYNNCVSILKGKTKIINPILIKSTAIPTSPLNQSENKMNQTSTNYTEYVNSINLDFTKRDYGEPSDFLNIIQKTKKKITSTSLDNIKKIALSHDSHKGKEIVKKIMSLDKKIMRLDKDLIKALEKNKE